MMATDEAEYESDPEELKRSLATRRREASDDEEDQGVKASDDEYHDEADSYYDDDDDDDDLEYIDKASVAVVSEPKGVEADERNGEDVVEAEEKPKEPFAVPTAGAFYMHDDRFQEFDKASSIRPMRGGRRLWQSRDESKWGHDKYEEMNTQHKHFDRRTSRGRGRGRGYSRGTNSKALTSNGHQNQFPKAATRGRGSRRYEPALRNGNQAPSLQNKQSRHSYVKVSQVDTGREPAETDAIQTKKNVVASSLNSASPPFYPSGTSNNLAQKGVHAGMGRLHVNENPTPSGKKVGNTKSSLSWVRTAQPSQTTSQGRGYQQSLSQGDKVSSPMQIREMPKGTVQNCNLPPGQAFDQQSAVTDLLPSSPLKPGSLKKQYLSGESNSATESGALVAKEKGTLQPSGRGSFMYGGTQFMGPAGSNPNFPAFLPVMQIGGQHGGVPTFGMALPGYVQPEHGTGNPEMTWLPILAGPRALGASYSSYASIDGSYQAHKPGLPSSAGSSSQENSSSNPNDEEKPVERLEVTNNGNSQQLNSNPNKQPRRYSEMSFSN